MSYKATLANAANKLKASLQGASEDVAPDGGVNAAANLTDPIDPIQHVDFVGIRTKQDGGRKEAEDKGLSKKVMQTIKDEWIREQMRERRDEYNNTHQLDVFVGTWNVNGKKPSENLEAWLTVGGARRPDIYVIGLQEMVDLTAGNVVMDSASKERAAVWLDAIDKTLLRMHGSRQYRPLMERHLVGVMLCVFVHGDHLDKLSKGTTIQSTVTATGVIGLGNKGGVCIRVQLYDTTFCFVCAHLAAHRDAVEARNADFKSIMTKSAFRDDTQTAVHDSAEKRLSAPADATEMNPYGTSEYRKSYEAILRSMGGVEDLHISGNSGGDLQLDGHQQLGSLNLSPVLSNPTFGIIDHDYVFWLGDFNYRIQLPHSIDAVFEHVDANDLPWLRANDQLIREQSAGRVFQGFKEGEIQFLPTYKYQPGTNSYDRRPEKKVRAPAFCDRILWRDTNGCHARIKKYMSCPTLCSSDHKPVFALFDVSVKERAPVRRTKVFGEIIRQLDRKENAERPQISLDRKDITFHGGLRYMEQREEKVRVTNTGKRPVTWRFVPKLEDQSICGSWLRLEPDFGLLTPGDSVEISVTAFVDAHTARRCNQGTESLEDIIVLRLESGCDHFICVAGEMIPTCFGVDLAKLVRKPFPFAASPAEQQAAWQQRVAKLGSDKAKLPLKLPKELWWLCNFLWVYDLFKVRGLFVHSARKASGADVARVRRCIDVGAEIVPESDGEPDSMAHAVACVIMEFLCALPDPVVPWSMFPKVDVDNVSMEAWGRRFLDQLPTLSHNVFVYIITFCREMLKCETYNAVAPGELAGVFARCLLRPAQAALRQREASQQNINIPFGLSKLLSGDKEQVVMEQTAEKVVMHFLNSGRAFVY